MFLTHETSIWYYFNVLISTLVGLWKTCTGDSKYVSIVIIHYNLIIFLLKLVDHTRNIVYYQTYEWSRCKCFTLVEVILVSCCTLLIQQMF